MVFEILYAERLDKQYIITGKLMPTFDDYDIFAEIRESYRTLINEQNMSFGIHLILREEYVMFNKVNMDTVSGILNLFKQNLNAKIQLEFSDDCIYEPRSCEPLVKMESRRQFQK